MTLDYIERITPAVIKRIIDDTSVPKTYRTTFARYLDWKDEKEATLND